LGPNTCSQRIQFDTDYKHKEVYVQAIDYSIQFPESPKQGLSQDREYFVIEDKTHNRTYRIRFHDYQKIYSIQGLYEYLFHEKLKCCSPEIVCGLLREEVEKSPNEVEDLVVLDLGAGNGMVGELLHQIGVESVYGVDIIEEAAEAVERDRPNIYEDYYIADLTKMSDSFRKKLKAKEFNCMTTVATLGFGDIPPRAFAEGFNLLSTPAWISFNIKEDFFSDKDSTGFSLLIHRMMDAEIFKVYSRKCYQHRLSIENNPLYYIAFVGVKKAEIPQRWFTTEE